MGQWKVGVKPRTRPYLGDERYRLVSVGERYVGVDVAIIACDEAAADELRRRAGVLSVRPDDSARR